jgi:hypothetical protein
LLGLLLNWLLALLGLFALRAGRAANRFAGKSAIGSQSRQGDCDEQFPLHAAHVTTPRLNGKLISIKDR